MQGLIMDSTTQPFAQSFQQWWQQGQAFYNQLAQQMLHDNPLQQALRQQSSDDFVQWVQALQQQPLQLAQQQHVWWQQQLQIMQQSALLALGQDASAVMVAESGDKRFNHPAWQQNPWFYYIQQSYQLLANTLLNSIRQSQGMPVKVKERLEFSARQMMNSVAPSNFISTNPELLQATIDSQGQNLWQGFQLLQQDLARSGDMLRISMTREDAFTLGQDVARTPGQVVFQNQLFELIQYTPHTAQVARTPLLMVPPYVNKYYILDLSAENSLVDFAVQQGHSVFMISWRNPDATMKDVDFADYVIDGVLSAIEQVCSITGENEINALGYCIGGTLLVTAMAYQAAKRGKPRIKSATLLTTLLDFSQPGELGVFINDATISAIENNNQQYGFMPGDLLGLSFSMLRENSLYWNYYVNNYLKGKTPIDLDVLFWNGDSTNISAACHSFMLRELYLHNKLVQAKAIRIAGVAIDLSKVKQPVYMLSTRDDHIALWQATWQGIAHTNADVTFVLGESGHIAGVVNPPQRQKYGYWIAGEPKSQMQDQAAAMATNAEQLTPNTTSAQTASQWFANAHHHSGSWWPHWQQWLGQYQGEWVEARALDHNRALYPAPGQYVRATLQRPTPHSSS
jgi:polyhydroxyalkanoate synthase